MATFNFMVIESPKTHERRVAMRIGIENGIAVMEWSWTPKEAEQVATAIAAAAKEAGSRIVSPKGVVS